MTASTQSNALQEQIARVPIWYHTLELAPGIETPGYFDLRPIVDKLPWPDVQGKRCLDIGTWDGFFAFELERRGAAEVVAADLPASEEWDLPPRIRAKGAAYFEWAAGPKKGLGFEIAHGALASSAQLVDVSVYDLNPDRFGTFDVVVCGSLLLHLRDPIRALNAIRSVCDGVFLSTNQVDLLRSVTRPKQPLLRLDGLSDLSQWFLPNSAAHKQMVTAGGFDVVGESKLYSIPFGTAHPSASGDSSFMGSIRRAASRAVRPILTGNHGVPHHAILATPID